MIYKIKQNRVSRTYKGGSRIDKFTQEVFVKKGMYPEDWTASATAVKNSSGMTEGIGITENGEKITDIIGNDILPILVKLLDADERLVIQVHPTVNFSQRYLNSSFGKTECWYFLDCSPDAHIYLGFKPDITAERWRKAIQNDDSEQLLDMLWRIPVHKGDFVFVDGGMPHAIGGGCFMIELQEPSDFMFVAEKKTVSGVNIPDYRLDMGLGFETGLRAYNYQGYTAEELREKYISHPTIVKNGVCHVLGAEQTDKFTFDILCGNAACSMDRKYAVAVVLSGKGTICGKLSEQGDRFFLCDETPVICGDTDFRVAICR